MNGNNSGTLHNIYPCFQHQDFINYGKILIFLYFYLFGPWVYTSVLKHTKVGGGGVGVRKENTDLPIKGRKR